tara:strand:+ start:271 stop:615 length:345 start_codon:yes stop_codon:yes gene_type:complete
MQETNNEPWRRHGVTVKCLHETGKYYINAQYRPDGRLMSVKLFHKYQEDINNKGSYVALFSSYLTEMIQKFHDPIKGLQEISDRELRRTNGSAMTIVGHVADHLLTDYYLEEKI